MQVAARQPRLASAVRRTIFERWQLVLPAVVTALLAFRAGGFFPGATAMLAATLALILVARVTLAASPFAGWSAGLVAAAGALALLAGWTLLSATWSDAPARALLETDRTLVYLLMLGLLGSFAVRVGDLDVLLRAVALVLGGVALAALLTRLYPDTFTVATTSIQPARLSFPLTYWNAVGVLCALGAVLALHCTAGAGHGPVARVLGAGALPVLATTLYFTFSRGGIATAAVGVLAYAVLAHPRRLLTALVAAGPATYLAVRGAYGADRLATAEYARATAEAADVASTVVLAVVGAMALRALGLVADRRLDRVVVSRRARATALGAAAVVALAAAVIGLVATDLPDRAREQRESFFRAGVLPTRTDQRDRLLAGGANGRIEQWKIARDAYRDAPLKGAGAGTYRLAWERDRDTIYNVVDAHSLYLETLAELGLPGLLALVTALAIPLVLAARRLLGPERHAHGAFLAVALALLVHAGVDWDWEMPVLFAWLFGAAGVVCAARVGRERLGAPGRPVRVLAGLACLLIAVMPVRVAVSQAALDRAVRAFKAGDCAAATDAALDSLDALRARPEPFELLGYCDLRAGEPELAVGAMRAARERDPRDWQYAYGQAVAEAIAGRDPRASAALAVVLNPRDARPVELDAALRRVGGSRRWSRIAARARVPLR